MNSPFEAVQTAALQLPQEDRLRLLEDLLNSLVPEGQDEAALDELATQRQHALLAGHVQTIPLAEAMQAAGLATH
jgi:hypothetical protein